MTTIDSRPITRFTPTNPCPICGGHDREQRGAGVRCWGFLSADRAYAHCTRGEHAGALPQNSSSLTYGHRLDGDCRCGVSHGSQLGNLPSCPRAATSESPKSKGRGKNYHVEAPHREVAVYPYHDKHGALLYEVVRFEPKGFAQRTPAGWGLNGTDPVLYRLPEVRAADPWLPVFVCEGERDVDRLRSLGLVATANPGGAGRWKPAYSEELRGRQAIVLQDNDQAGRDHVATVARDSLGIAASVRILALPGLPNKGDVSDWLDAGGTREELLRLAADMTPETPEPTHAPAPASGPCGDELAAARARIDQLEAALAEAGARLRASLALDRNPAIKTQRTTVKSIGFELASAYDGGRADPDGWVKVWNPRIAANAGINEDRFIVHTATMVRDGLIEKKTVREPDTRVDPQTGEIVPDYSRPPVPRVYLRCSSVTDLFTKAATWTPSPDPKKPGATSWGGKREPCPTCGSERRKTTCADCGHVFEPDPHLADQDPKAEEAQPGPAVLTTYHPQDADQAGVPPLTPLQQQVLALAERHGYRAVTITRDTEVGPGVDDWIGWVTTEATDGRLRQCAGILAARVGSVGAAS